MADTLSNTIFVPTFCIKSYVRCVQHQYRAERLRNLFQGSVYLLVTCDKKKS
nr:MAG TPA: hypothetical protein [Caudoviricetes sp.]